MAQKILGEGVKPEKLYSQNFVDASGALTNLDPATPVQTFNLEMVGGLRSEPYNFIHVTRALITIPSYSYMYPDDQIQGMIQFLPANGVTPIEGGSFSQRSQATYSFAMTGFNGFFLELALDMILNITGNWWVKMPIIAICGKDRILDNVQTDIYPELCLFGKYVDI